MLVGAKVLAESDRSKDVFLAMLVHDLRNPLAPNLNCLGLIRQQRPESQDHGLSLEIAERQVRHMARLLDDLLDVSRFTQGKIQLKRAPGEFSTVVSHPVEMARPLIETKKPALFVDLPPQP